MLITLNLHRLEIYSDICIWRLQWINVLYEIRFQNIKPQKPLFIRKLHFRAFEK